ETQLQERLNKPVLHDDQHGTAVVALAALINAARYAGRNLRESTVGQIGLGAAGTGIARLLRAYGVGRVLGTDRNPAAIARLVSLGGERGAAFAADGKGINNVLAFPGLFKGALSARARRFSGVMLMAAADAIAQLARADELVPDPLDKNVHERVAAAVHEAATPAGCESIEVRRCRA